ncbi:MAG: LPXTG cell wall anchor domain-containing protein, partial [Romboutsia sp.]|nr:LPXTG cell wall anchor domain-containing protein [Romboutsia sp.]
FKPSTEEKPGTEQKPDTEEKPVPEQKPDTEEKPVPEQKPSNEETDLPQTGDNSNLPFMIILLVISTTGLVYFRKIANR